MAVGMLVWDAGARRVLLCSNPVSTQSTPVSTQSTPSAGAPYFTAAGRGPSVRKDRSAEGTALNSRSPVY